MHDKLLKIIIRGHLKIKYKIVVSSMGSQGSNGLAGRIEGVSGVSAPGGQSPTGRKIDVLKG